MKRICIIIVVIFIIKEADPRRKSSKARNRICPAITPVGCMKGYITECCNNSDCIGGKVCCHINWMCSVSCMQPRPEHIGQMRPYNQKKNCPRYTGVEHIFFPYIRSKISGR
ncbi:hypothetical protein AVEN_130978-1 [Araneus ventricosus]|uniref:WAP domain-containing protein n=1 Tax=Araneus ventricosus TaxID=182803 RepID=A0A4Y2DI12_ARAVE|nr:hypothetical protein AVEN_130978-1 [Araneus ventricosus]